MSDTKSQRKKGADRAQEPALRCPRCDSPNTKFCYYNNYSLSQPRHFCKTCRRYWTKGGTLRNVPIGGGCQKGKKAKSSSSRLAMDSTISDVGGLRFFQVISPGAMDFQLNFPRLSTPNPGLCCQFPSPNPAIATNPCFSFDPTSEATSSSIGLGFPISSAFKPLEGRNTAGFQEMGSYNRSFQSELHWKLQQQRLSMLVFGDHNPNIATPSMEPATSIQKQQPIFFQNLEISNLKQQATAPTRKDDTNANPSTEWLLEHSYATQLTPTLATNPTTANEATNWSTNEGSFGIISGI